MAKPRGVSFGKMEQAILETAADLFDRKGFNQTSLQDIADAIGMARPSLYHYFSNREQILAAGIDQLSKRRDAMVDDLRALDGDPVQRLTALMLGLGTLISEHPVWVRILLRDEAALPEDTGLRDRESRLAFLELLVGRLDRSREVGRGIEQCLAGRHDLRVAVPLVRIEVLARLPHVRRPPSRRPLCPLPTVPGTAAVHSGAPEPVGWMAVCGHEMVRARSPPTGRPPIQTIPKGFIRK